jgi:hypothetical protein
LDEGNVFEERDEDGGANTVAADGFSTFTQTQSGCEFFALVESIRGG